MALSRQKIVWTIGHSTRTIEHFIAMLNSFKIEMLADIRSYPGSKRYPHFNKEALETSLPANGIYYNHLKDLGGRRSAKQDSKNTGWKNAAFRGYADYMETEAFKKAIDHLQTITTQHRTACMCSEAVWWRCHRSLVSDFLKLHGWTVYHIMEVGKSQEHSYTPPARIVHGMLTYSNDSIIFN